MNSKNVGSITAYLVVYISILHSGICIITPEDIRFLRLLSVECIPVPNYWYYHDVEEHLAYNSAFQNCKKKLVLSGTAVDFISD